MVLAGSFEERGYSGRLVATEGDVLVHHDLDAHGNTMLSRGAWLLRLPLPPKRAQDAFAEGGYRVDRLDDVVRLAARNVGDASAVLAARLAKVAPRSPVTRDWPDVLAADLRGGEPFALDDWARAHGLAPATVSRGFRQVHAVPPSVYRAELRARRAWQEVRRSAHSLAAIALDAGFADQAHMSRAVRSFTGAAPGAWRRGTELA